MDKGYKNTDIRAGLLGIIFTLCLLFIMLVTAVEAVCYWTPGYFEAEYEKYDVLSDLPEMTMSDEDGLMAVTEHMMHYLRGDEGYDELQIEVMMDGEMRGFFTEREIAHMEDVRELFIAAQKLRLWAAALCAVCVAGMFALCASGVRVDDNGGTSGGRGRLAASLRSFARIFSRSVLVGTGLLLVLLLGLAFILATDFSNAFVTFHHIFFDNDLWILDPMVDMLINIVPEGFFYDTAMRIAAIFGAGVVVLLAAAAVMAMKTGKK